MHIVHFIETKDNLQQTGKGHTMKSFLSKLCVVLS